MNKRLSAIAVSVIGLLLIVVALTQNLFAVGPAFEDLIEDFRPALTDESIATLRSDLGMLGGAVDEFQTGLAPALATQLNVDPATFSALMAEQFPDVITGIAVVPEAGPTFTGIIDLLDEQQGNFASADAIPTTSLPATTVPWGIVLVGLIFVGVGGYLLTAQTRRSAIVATIAGVLVVAGVFGLSLTGKSADADALNEALKPVYTEETVVGAAQAVAAIEAMGAEMQTAMLPGLGGMLGMTESEVQSFLGAQFPALATALGEMPEALQRFDGVVTTFDQNLANYATLRPVAFAPIIWTVIAGALLVLVACGATLRSYRNEIEPGASSEANKQSVGPEEVS